MATPQTLKNKNEKETGRKDPEKLPPGKTRCYISKQVVDESETVEIEYNGVKVKVDKRYAGA